jgi:spermidine synthase
MSVATPDAESPSRASTALWLFVPALFLSSFLMFLVEPMVGKMVLPLLGGAPAVWNTCMLFFQMTLLAGYGIAHVIGTRLRLRHQIPAYVGLILTPFVVFPLGIPSAGAPPDTNPEWWLLTVLIAAIGLPFLVLSTTASVLQRWFSELDGRAARDPYFLYAASNLGSLIALLLYPFLLEPAIRLTDQRRLWSIGYGFFVAVACACASIAWRQPWRALLDDRDMVKSSGGRLGQVTLPWRRRLRWVALAFVPSSLMLAVTQYLSVDIAPVPLLWIVPLSLYLLTFVIAFSPMYDRMRGLILRALPIVVLLLVVLLIAGLPAVSVTVPFHLLAFFVIALMCHGELARDRPSPEYLTTFYLMTALGGTLGGVFNTFVAPHVFTSIAEYPIVVVLACVLRPALSVDASKPRRRIEMILVPLAVGGLTFLIPAAIRLSGASQLMALVGLLFPAILSLSQSKRPAAFAAAIALMLLAGRSDPSPSGPIVYAERTFFGVYRVRVDSDGRYHRLFHGRTLHGVQRVDTEHRDEPLTYYHRTGPFGQLLAANQRVAMMPEIAVVGLGVGALASYAGPGQLWTFYEIDPAVERLSTAGYFTFLNDCGDRCRVVIGDARLSLAAAKPEEYGLIVLDAFSSDAIPVHLLTAEAVSLYLSRLAPHGLLAFHVSNRHLTLGPILGRIATGVGFIALEQNQSVTPSEADAGKAASRWVVMAKDPEDLGSLASDSRWAPPAVSPFTPLWTDDFSNILSALITR